jgi:hypothetical protein
MLERAKALRALVRVATVIGARGFFPVKMILFVAF